MGISGAEGKEAKPSRVSGNECLTGNPMSSYTVHPVTAFRYTDAKTSHRLPLGQLPKGAHGNTQHESRKQTGPERSAHTAPWGPKGGRESHTSQRNGFRKQMEYCA